MSDLYDKTKLEKRFKALDAGMNLLKQKILGTAQSANIYPKRASWFFIDAVGTALTRNANYTSIEYQALWEQGSADDGDSWTLSAVLAAGNYTFYTIGRAMGGNGLLDYYLDGVSIETGQDWYGGGTNGTEEFTFSVPSSGYHVFTLTVNGKNGSSSDYYMRLGRLWIVPTSD